MYRALQRSFASLPRVTEKMCVALESAVIRAQPEAPTTSLTWRRCVRRPPCRVAYTAIDQKGVRHQLLGLEGASVVEGLQATGYMPVVMVRPVQRRALRPRVHWRHRWPCLPARGADAPGRGSCTPAETWTETAMRALSPVTAVEQARARHARHGGQRVAAGAPADVRPGSDAVRPTPPARLSCMPARLRSCVRPTRWRPLRRAHASD